MNAVVEYSRRGAASYTSVGFWSGGGDVDDVLERLSNVETGVAELRTEVRVIAANMSHLATAKSVSDLKTEVASIAAAIPNLAARTEVASIAAAIPNLAARSEVASIAAVIPYLATKADLQAEIGCVTTKIASLEAAIMKWFIATGLTSAALAFSIAKLVH